MKPDSSRLEPAKAQGLPAKARGRCAERKLRRTGSVWPFCGLQANRADRRRNPCARAHHPVRLSRSAYSPSRWMKPAPISTTSAATGQSSGPYDPNNHLLCFRSSPSFPLQLFHTSDFTLRLPTDVAGFFVLGFHHILETTGTAHHPLDHSARCLHRPASARLLRRRPRLRPRHHSSHLAPVLLHTRTRFLAHPSGLAMAAGFTLAFSILGMASARSSSA